MAVHPLQPEGTTMVDTTEAYMATTWAQALTNDRLANDLAKLAGSIRFHAPVYRDALLREAASRLCEPLPATVTRAVKATAALQDILSSAPADDEPDYRRATQAEADLFNHYGGIEGAVKVEHGVFVPVDLEPVGWVETRPMVGKDGSYTEYQARCSCGWDAVTRLDVRQVQVEGREHGETTGHDASNV